MRIHVYLPPQKKHTAQMRSEEENEYVYAIGEIRKAEKHRKKFKIATLNRIRRR